MGRSAGPSHPAAAQKTYGKFAKAANLPYVYYDLYAFVPGGSGVGPAGAMLRPRGGRRAQYRKLPSKTTLAPPVRRMRSSE